MIVAACSLAILLIHLFVNTKDDDAGMLTGLATFKAYAKDVAERCEAPPEPLRLRRTTGHY